MEKGFTSEFHNSFRGSNRETSWDDLIGAITSIQVQGTGVSLNAAEQTIEFTTGANLLDYAWISYQVKHSWKNGSVCGPHVHWEQTNNATPNILIRYRWQRNGQAKTTAWTDYKCNTNAFTYSSGTLNQISFGTGVTPPSGYSISDILQIRIFRDNANASGVFTGADAYTGVFSITSGDTHLELDSDGSRQEYSK